MELWDLETAFSVNKISASNLQFKNKKYTDMHYYLGKSISNFTTVDKLLPAIININKTKQ